MSSNEKSTTSTASSKTVSAKILGDFVLLKNYKIGEGSFAEVYKGYRKSDKVQVAIKVIPKRKIDQNPKVKKNLEDEISHMKQISTLKSPFVVNFLSVQRSKNHYYLVLEFCSGGDLSKYMKKQPIPEQKAKRFLSHIARGLKCLRMYNIVHRDLKPQNLLLSSHREDAVLKIADFGFAKQVDPGDLTATICGSPLYMAPEILSQNPYNEKADLWSVGVIVYEMLTGYLPYQANSIIQLQNAISERPPIIPSNLSHEAMDLLYHLLQRNPHKRMSFEDFFNHPFVCGKSSLYETSSDNSELKLLPHANQKPSGSPTKEKNTISEEKNTSPRFQNTMHNFNDNTVTTSGPLLHNSQEDSRPISAFISPDKKPVPKPTKISPFKDVLASQHVEKSLSELEQTKGVDMKNIYGFSPQQSLSKVVTLSESGHITFAFTFFDFSTLKCDPQHLQLATMVEEQAKRAWAIGEVAYLHSRHHKSLVALSLYTKALQLLAETVKSVKSLFNFEFIDEVLQVDKQNAIPQRITACFYWIRQIYKEFIDRSTKIHSKLKNSTLSTVTTTASSSLADFDGSSSSGSNSSHTCTELVLYRFALKIAKESATNEYSSNTTESISMYMRSILLLEYLLHNCEYITHISDKENLAKYAGYFARRIESLKSKNQK